MKKKWLIMWIILLTLVISLPVAIANPPQRRWPGPEPSILDGRNLPEFEGTRRYTAGSLAAVELYGSLRASLLVCENGQVLFPDFYGGAYVSTNWELVILVVESQLATALTHESFAPIFAEGATYRLVEFSYNQLQETSTAVTHAINMLQNCVCGNNSPFFKRLRLSATCLRKRHGSTEPLWRRNLMCIHWQENISPFLRYGVSVINNSVMITIGNRSPFSGFDDAVDSFRQNVWDSPMLEFDYAFFLCMGGGAGNILPGGIVIMLMPLWGIAAAIMRAVDVYKGRPQ